MANENNAANAAKAAAGKAGGFLKEFKEFALKGNVMDMAVGVIIGAAFGNIVTALTDSFINPLIGLVTGGAQKDPETGQMLAKYALPALNVSSCCFGGENMDTLFITTASQDTDTHVYPLAGNVFCMKPVVKGALSYRYKG